MARLSSITVYPIKSLPGVQVSSARVLASGALEWDRRWAIIDAAGEWLNGKRTPAVHRIRAHFDFHQQTVELSNDGATPAQFSLAADLEPIERWLTDFFAAPVRLAENSSAGFPDDSDSPGPTLLSLATLEEVSRWFPGFDVAEMRRRFRANLEIDDVVPFWEDRLCGAPGESVPFAIGSVRLEGTNPCQRCIVPTRHSETGETWLGFAKQFAQHRAQTLPDWAPRARFDHFYRLSVNTRPAIGHEPGEIRVGAPLVL